MRAASCLILAILLAGTVVAAQEGTAGASEVQEYLQKCQDSLNSDQVDEAIEWGEMAVAAAPGNPECHLWLGHALGTKANEASIFKKSGYAKKCKDAYETAVALDPDNLDYRYALLAFLIQAPTSVGGGKDKAMAQAEEIAKISPPRGHYARATIHLHEKDDEAAEQEIQQAIELDPTDTRSHHLLAAIFQERNETDKLTEVLDRILKIDPEDGLAATGLCQYLIQKGEIERARELLSGVVERDSTDAIAHYLMAIACFQSDENLAEGIGYMETSLALDTSRSAKDRAKLYVRLGRVCEKTGDTERAAAEYRKALELNPKDKDAKKSLGRFEGGD
jgi:tetratricopeptide (TPR) repeat protein